MTNISVTKPYQKRRRYSEELKARIVAECLKPGASPNYQIKELILRLRSPSPFNLSRGFLTK